ncbi:MAG: oxidoreductase [Sphingomonas sp.]|uniref:PDR/VanB family oxidoreductase n=1 Tax=Sphingomonas sp. TaxID=28214 RepID=UPI001AC79B32|nr:PDR/VanB family oxidoreductase [Sphingomonas sp.]MBN8816506.1 oxidoreductase [Sphingomonas sp.]
MRDVFSLVVDDIRQEAEDVKSFYLRNNASAPLPDVDPGAHVELILPDGRLRSYSLSNMPDHRGLYRLTVARDRGGSGGSIYMHDKVRVGDVVQASSQVNNFKLNVDAPSSLFIAGGIGITPFVPMIASLNELRRPWRLIYSARTRHRAALLNDLSQLEAAGVGQVELNFNEEPGGVLLNIAKIITELQPEQHVYCCGPEPMLDSFRSEVSAKGIADSRVHYEYFKGNVDAATDGNFDVLCSRSNLTVHVKAGQTILNALTSAGIDIPFACSEGICGSCKTKVIEGIPDHRDLILSSTERNKNNVMYVCCSGSRSQRLVLDC